ncbi:hypothetical protein BP5796_12908 [Coleophoma crateriformis]|uniref:5-oxoprolinase n=1 Tax=Coleophoma crateriformis TaxID=565419 RepID=A0A3D8Q4T9_9HELO|nr:hypothetical protein BP5796_12908 [Coleophoma crateriformis]
MPHADSSPTLPIKGIRIAIDRGGTFTDCLGIIPGRSDILVKLLSNDPANYADAPTEGIRRILETVTGEKIPRGQKIDTSKIESIKMGTTVATNALLERSSTPCALVVTRGFKDLLRIGDQTRPDIFALDIQRPDTLFEDVLEVDERVTLYDSTEDMSLTEGANAEQLGLIRGIGGELIRVIQPLDVEKSREGLQALYDKGVRAIAVTTLHSYTYPEHELQISRIASEIGFTQISLSGQIFPMIKAIARGYSATADAYLTPLTKAYVDGFRKGFVGSLEESGGVKCEFMQSVRCQSKKPVIGFDMGGTSTDVSRYAGKLEHTFESVTAGITIQSPQLEVETVAAGGGSVLTYQNGRFAAGPESASAHPGPVAYRKGGPLTVTDANLILGRLQAKYFPNLFGKNEDEPLDAEGAHAAFERLAAEINADLERTGGKAKSIEDIALGFLDVANETMCRPIRSLTEAKGYTPSQHDLAVFGGAGGQHACAIAANLGIGRILIHRYSSILSAYGMALAELVHDLQEPCSLTYSRSNEDLETRFANLERKVAAKLAEDGIPKHLMSFEHYLNLRYAGSDTTFMIERPADGDFATAFIEEHRRQFSFIMADRDILVEDVRVRGKAQNSSPEPEFILSKQLAEAQPAPVSSNKCTDTVRIFFENGWVSAPLYKLLTLTKGDLINGPAMILDDTQTIVVAPHTKAIILDRHVVIDLEKNVEITEAKDQDAVGAVDPVRLSVMAHRFMSIAEQMGHALQKTSVSVNIKERLDFSCALFGPSGQLVANAPHVPIHLGSMEQAVVYQHQLHAKHFRPGDVIVANHPISGGTHLPDITCITPVFNQDGTEIIFYTASRGHHQEIGGILPGSMPAGSVELWEEGAAIVSHFLVRDNQFDEAGMRKLMYEVPGQYPGCSGTRKLADNINDLKAQVSANAKGANLVRELIEEFGLEEVHFYMDAITLNAEASVRKFLRETSRKFEGKPLQAVDYMDDGTPIQLTVTIDGETGSAEFDWTGTGAEGYNSYNAPSAITKSASLYVLRCLIAQDIPLNQGCLRPIKFIIPEGTILNPSPTAAVCAGNPITSQRITDVLIKAFEACAASQGDCNVFSFGHGGKDAVTGEETQGFGFCETICGGSGAGEGWHGTSGVHVHITNTRITDPEVLEKRYPVILREFSIREGSGGEGKYRGGNGITRDYEFLRPLSGSIVSERRATRPYGLAGGGPAASGINYLVRKTEQGERWCRLGGRKDFKIATGDRFVIQTPGGGGWGNKDDSNSEPVLAVKQATARHLTQFQIRQEQAH